MNETSPWLVIESKDQRFVLKVEGKPLVASLCKFARDLVTGKTTELIVDAGEAFKALGLKANLAAFLLQRAMSQALQEIVADNRCG